MIIMRDSLSDRARDEAKVEVQLLRSHWWILLLGGLFQYVHGAFTAVAYHMHEPQSKPLKDLGFIIIPELGEQYDWIGESLFWTLFISLLAFSFTPFLRRAPKFYTVVLWSRFFTIVCTCQALRIVSFLSTGLPGPAPHCRLGRATATLAWPDRWWKNVFFDAGRQAAHSCGDLLFSSHNIFLLNGAYTYSVYGSRLPIKLAVWAVVSCICCLIIASRKHYTVDVVVAWYVVPLVFFTWKRFWLIQRRSELEGFEPIDGGGPKFSLEDDDEELTDIIVANSGGGQADNFRDDSGSGGGRYGSSVSMHSGGSMPSSQQPRQLELAQRRQGCLPEDADPPLQQNGSLHGASVDATDQLSSNLGSSHTPERLDLKSASSPPPERTVI